MFKFTKKEKYYYSISVLTKDNILHYYDTLTKTQSKHYPLVSVIDDLSREMGVHPKSVMVISWGEITKEDYEGLIHVRRG